MQRFGGIELTSAHAQPGAENHSDPDKPNASVHPSVDVSVSSVHQEGGTPIVGRRRPLGEVHNKENNLQISQGVRGDLASSSCSSFPWEHIHLTPDFPHFPSQGM